MDWLELLAVQGTLKRLLQHHSSKASILWHPAFFIVQLSHPYMATGKTIALTIWTFVGKVMSLFFNRLSKFVIAFFPRSNFMAAVTIRSDFEAQENQVCHHFHCFSIYLPWSNGIGWHHWLHGNEFERSQGVSEGQGSLAYWSWWGCKELDMTQQLNDQ